MEDLLPDVDPRAYAEQVKSDLKEVGWSKAAELAKVQEEFKDEVEKFPTGSSEPTDLIYFKLYES